MFKNILAVGAIATAAAVGTKLATNLHMNNESTQNSGGDVSISDLNFLIEPGTGYLRVMGIIHNNTDQWIMAECHITSYDAAGKPIDVDGWQAEYEKEVHPNGEDADQAVESIQTPSIPPHGKVCLNHVRDGKKLKSTPANVKVKVADVVESGVGITFSNPEFTFTPRIETQKIHDGSSKTYDRGFIIKGSVTNIGKTTSTRSRLAVIWYNKSGKIVEIEEKDLYSGIPAGKNINNPGSYLLSSHKTGDISPGENRAFSGSLNWPKSIEATKDFGKFVLLTHDEAWVD
jgi:hypothetical protein